MKVVISQNVMSIVSDYSLTDLGRVAKFRPEALKLYTGEGTKKELDFVVKVGGYEGSFGRNGLVFTDEAVGTHKAVISANLPQCMNDADEIKEYIREALGLAIVKGTAVEGQIATAMDEISADEAAIDACISGLPENTDAE